MAKPEVKYTYCIRKDCVFYNEINYLEHPIWHLCLKCEDFVGLNVYQKKVEEENHGKTRQT